MPVTINGTSGVSDVDGTAASPAFRGTDTNTGMFFPAADTIAFSEGGVEAMRLDSSGNVGIGTTSPSYRLHVVSATENGAFVSDGTRNFSIINSAAAGGPVIGAYSNHPLLITTNNTERMRIDTSGNLLLGATSIGAQIRFISRGASTSSGDYTAFFVNGAGTTLGFFRNDGAVNTGNAALSPYNLTTANAANLFVDSSGFVYRATSSLKYKTDVQDATHGLADVLKLRPVTYKGKNDGDKVFGGLIAEEVHEAGLTEFVQYAEDGSPDALHYGNMVSLCVKAIQELKTQNDELRARVAALEGAK